MNAKIVPIELVEDSLSFDDVHIDFLRYQASKAGEEVKLSKREFEILRYFSRRCGIPISRDELLDRVWGFNRYPTTRTVDNFIARLRYKLSRRCIQTIHGVGYRFMPQ